MTIHFGDDKVHQLSKVESKFQVLKKAYVQSLLLTVVMKLRPNS